MSRARLAGAVATLLAAGALAACGSSVTPATATQRWASSGSFAQGVQDLFRDTHDVQAAIARHEAPDAIRTACLELFQDANGENTDLLPSPDAQLTALLSGAYGEFVHAAAVCDEQPGSAAALATVGRDLHDALGGLIAAALREEAVARRSLHVAGLP